MENLGGGSRGLLGDSGLALTEAVLEAARHILQVAQAASAGGLTADGLLAPVVLADPGGRVAAGRALALLHVKGAPTAAAAQRVSLVPTLTERSGTLACLTHGG